MNAARIVGATAALIAVLTLGSCGGGSSSSSDTSGVPTATLTAPAPFASGLTGTVAITATATDNTAVTLVEFEVDSVPVGSDSSVPYEVSVDTTAYAAGQHIVRARARDAAGNVSAWSSATVRFGGSAAVPRGFTKNESFVTGLSSATAFVQAPDGRLFVAEQGGRVRIFKNGLMLPLAFLQLNVDARDERGLIGITLDPNFAGNGFVYVHYTTPSGGTHNRVSRFSALGDIAQPGSEVVLVDLPPLSGATNHNGGAIHFGTDGKLYVGVGENADASKAQNLADPMGKLLRFNADGSIPSDNPFFATQSGLARAIWVYGLRNPFTFAVQPGTGRIHINDVGTRLWEEINLGGAGANYGWPASEGPDNVSGNITGPLFAYRHGAASPVVSGPAAFFTGFTIAGSTFYLATGGTGAFPAPYRDSYYFADFVSRFIGRLDLANGNAAYAFASISDSPVDMLVGLDGALYVLGRGSVTRISAP